jgi:putative serine protease PepD
MRSSAVSHLLASLIGGLVVAVTFVVFGVAGQRSTPAVIEEAPAAGTVLSGHGHGPTAHQIYVHDAPAVVYVRAAILRPFYSPFGIAPESGQTALTGSGFLISRRGLILTTYHVIEGSDPSAGITVQFQDSGPRRAAVVATDTNNDLAVLQVNMSGLPPIRPIALADSSAVRVGDPTLTISNPFGLDRTLAGGIVSALQPELQTEDGFALDNVIQTNGAIDPSISGAPLLDAEGRAIGVNSLLAAGGAGSGASQALAFAVPINTAKHLLPASGSAGEATVAFLGVNARGGAARSASTLSASAPLTRGVAITVQPGGPAASGGLTNRDAIVAIDGQRVTGMAQVDALIHSRMPGLSVVLTVRRGKRIRSVHVVLGARAARAGGP